MPNVMDGLDKKNPTRVGVTSYAISPNNDADLPGGGSRGVWVGTGGDINATLVDDPPGHTGVVYKNVPIGLWPFAPRRIYATNTTATNLVGGT